MSFFISFVNPSNYSHVKVERGYGLGKIVIGEFEEVFESPLSYWSTSDYQNHWKEALERIVMGSPKSCLITSLYDPQRSNYLFWWLLYREGRDVHFQNQMLLLDQLGIDFDPENPYSFIKDREVVNEDGRLISEWHITIREIERFTEEF